MKHDFLIWDVVPMLNARGAGVIVVKLPRGNRSVVAHTAGDIDNACGPKVRPGEFFFTGPYELDGFAGGLRQASGFDCDIAGVLAAVARARVGHYHSDALFGNS